tara:strand:+ start:685 stop:864 length:180 start_codon:yes stop_codon:yes gene_type:complete
MQYNINTKAVLIVKSQYELVNKIKLEETLKRINKRFYDVKIISTPKYNKLIITPKIEEV